MTDYDLDEDDECSLCGGPLASDGVCADENCGDDEPTYPIFSTYSQRRAVLNGLPEVPAQNSEESR